MQVNISPMELVTGIHSRKSFVFKGENSEIKSLRHLFNVLNVVGWFPGVGIISGIARAVFTGFMFQRSVKNLNPAAKAFCVTMSLRSAVECFSLGFLFVPTDIIFTVGREIAYSSPKKKCYMA